MTEIIVEEEEEEEIESLYEDEAAKAVVTKSQ